MKYRFDGKEKLLSFGKYPLITLAIARAKRDDAKLLLDQGKDPAEVKKQKKRQRAALKQFEEIARAWHANREERSEEHTSELQSLMRISHAVFSLQKKNTQNTT